MADTQFENYTFLQAEVDEAQVHLEGVGANNARVMREIQTVIVTLKEVLSEVKHLRSELMSLRKSYDQHVLVCGENTQSESSSQSLLEAAGSSTVIRGSQATLKPTSVPFVTVKFDGHDSTLYLDSAVRESLFRATVSREAVRLLLVYIHGIPALRKLTRTGSRKSEEGESDVSQIEIQGLPKLTSLYIHAAVKKLFPFQEAIRENPEIFLQEKKRRLSDVNAHITSILQYFKNSYDDEGKKKVIKRKRKDASVKKDDTGLSDIST